MDKEALKGIWAGAIITTVFFGAIAVFLLDRIGAAVAAVLWMPAVVWVVAIFGTSSYLINERKKCPNCGKRMDKSVKFCKQCGAEVLANCPHCNAKLKSKGYFCEACGKSITEMKNLQHKEIKQQISPVDDEIEPTFFCTYCGSQIDQNLSVCPACGESFK